LELFPGAADALNLIQSAVSRPFRTLESRLAVQLFHRQRKRLCLSDAGHAQFLTRPDSFNSALRLIVWFAERSMVLVTSVVTAILPIEDRAKLPLGLSSCTVALSAPFPFMDFEILLLQRMAGKRAATAAFRPRVQGREWAVLSLVFAISIRQCPGLIVGWLNSAHPTTRSFSGVSVRYFATIQSLLEPIQHFGLNPSHPVRAELYPLRERPGHFQSGHVLWRVQNHLLELAF